VVVTGLALLLIVFMIVWLRERVRRLKLQQALTEQKTNQDSAVPTWPELSDGEADETIVATTAPAHEDPNSMTPRSGARASQRNFLHSAFAKEGLYEAAPGPDVCTVVDSGSASSAKAETPPLTTPANQPSMFARPEHTGRNADGDATGRLVGWEAKTPENPKLRAVLAAYSDPTSANGAAVRAWIEKQTELEKPASSISFKKALEDIFPPQPLPPPAWVMSMSPSGPSPRLPPSGGGTILAKSTARRETVDV